MSARSSFRRLWLLLWLFAGVAPAAEAQRAAGPDRPKDFLDPSFHRQRRELLRQALPASSVAVLFARPVRNRANDVDYIYHQDPDFYYLTGYDEPNAALLLFKEPQTVAGQAGVTEALFVQPRDARAEQWTGRRLGAEGAREQLKLQYTADNRAFATANVPWASFSHILFLGQPATTSDQTRSAIDVANLQATFRAQAGVPADYNPTRSFVELSIQRNNFREASALTTYLETLVQQRPSLATEPSVKAFLGASDAERQQLMAKPLGRYETAALDNALSVLREVKTPEEIALLRKAVLISAVGQQEVMKAVRPDMGEMEIQGLHEYVYKKYGAEFEGYPSIVGAGANACILHYETNDKLQVKNELLLMDCGAEYHGYTADVTRTIPPGGTFSPAQRQIYELVLAAQEAAFKTCRPGADFQAPGKEAQRVVAEGLIKLGIINSADESRRYFPHGTSHYLGLDVHDRGTYRPLQAGNVITVEPGIYIPEGSPCDKKWWNIGVRIEDDVLITAAGFENLSREAPRTVAEIEAMIAQPSALDDFKLPALK